MNKNNAVIYARYSSDKQTEQSIEGQIRYCTDYAKRCGYKIVGSYIDRAASGTSGRRPQFQNMIEDSKKKQFQYIIVWKLDRFSRNRYDSTIYKTKLKKCGVKVISATESLGEGDEALIKSKSTSIIEKINNKAEQLEIQKEDTEIELAELQIATDIQITYDEVYEWLERFCKGDLFDIEFRKRIIDVFINSIFLYDDKVIIYYNIKGSKQISYIEMLEETGHIDVSNMNGSDSFTNGEPRQRLIVFYEPQLLIHKNLFPVVMIIDLSERKNIVNN